MSTKLEAADAIRKMAKQFEHMVAAAALLDEVGTFEQAVEEAKAALADSQTRREAASKALAELEVEREQVKQGIVDTISQAEARAAALVKEADDTAAHTISEADAHAATVIAGAVHQALEIVDGAKAEAVLSQQTADSLKEQATEAGNAAVTARAELAKIQDQIAKAKDALRDFMQA